MSLFAWNRVRSALVSAALWFAVGFGTAVVIAPRGAPIRPAPIIDAPPPAPDFDNPPAPADTVRRGHLTVSFIEPLYTSPATATVRHDLAALDWASQDATFRAYTHGQAELTTLGFTHHYTTADLPIVFVQETLPDGSAPLIPPPLKAPQSAAAVLEHVKGLRSQ